MKIGCLFLLILLVVACNEKEAAPVEAAGIISLAAISPNDLMRINIPWTEFISYWLQPANDYMQGKWRIGP